MNSRVDSPVESPQPNGAARHAQAGWPVGTAMSPQIVAGRLEVGQGAVAEPSGALRPPRFPSASRDASVPLPRSDFLRALRRETHRADRSDAPLTLLLFDVAPGDVDELASEMTDRKRESDTVGVLAARQIGLLLPDTDAEGAKRLARPLSARIAPGNAAPTVLSYPDCLIDALLGSADAAPPAATGWPTAHPASGYRGKRALDIVGAALGLVLLSPVMAFAAVGIAVSSNGPVIFRQTRVGRGGLPFVFYKFRSMTWGVDEGVHRRYVTAFIQGALPPATDPALPKVAYKMSADARITPFGRWLRGASIDELPQLWNVLVGQMSLVGPRPPLPYEAEQYEAWHLRRVLEVQPGITGLWQVHGRSEVTFDDMVRMDLRYIRDCSLRLDLAILLKTVRVVLARTGAS